MAPGGIPLPLTGILIAVVASFINGSTFVLQRKGILRSREKGRSHKYACVYIYLYNSMATLLKSDIMNLIELLLNVFSTGRSYLTDVFWWTGTVSSEYSAI